MTPIDFQAARAAGIRAVIHKATEHDGYTDPRYHARRAEAVAAGMLWGSYHLSGPDDCDGVVQARHYLAYADPQPGEMVCFDCEKHGTLANMEAFVGHVGATIGRRPVIYGRRLLRHLMAGHGGSPVSACALWYDEYPHDEFSVPQEALPDGWADWTMWQFTDGKAGCQPRTTPGIGSCDRSAFKGTEAQFLEGWPFDA